MPCRGLSNAMSHLKGVTSASPLALPPSCCSSGLLLCCVPAPAHAQGSFSMYRAAGPGRRRWEPRAKSRISVCTEWGGGWCWPGLCCSREKWKAQSGGSVQVCNAAPFSCSLSVGLVAWVVQCRAGLCISLLAPQREKRRCASLDETGSVRAPWPSTHCQRRVRFTWYHLERDSQVGTQALLVVT